jgi:ATP-dependent phosphofructokinase / diphosphate-dependent phosphofructokinase
MNLIGNAIIGQSGGPTSVINNSLVGAIDACLNSQDITGIYGMNGGIEGVLKELFFDLKSQPRTVLDGLRKTPSSALSSSRHKLKDHELPKVLEILAKHNIRYFFLIGGNDTMDTVHRVEAYCLSQGYALRGIGIPKTVDNDLFGTDHTPGFASAARYNALSVKQAGQLALDMRKVDQFVVFQTIGREAGWLAAATACARQYEGDAPHLIYCPERRFNEEKFLKDAKACLNRYGWVSVVVSEGLLYEDGTPVSASKSKDNFSNTEFGAMGGASVGLQVHRMLRESTGLRGEFQIVESLNMSAIDRATEQDLNEAYECGKKAVEYALNGTSGVMVTIERLLNQPYKITYGQVPLSSVAVKAKAMPDHYINAEGNDISLEALEYLKPLVGKLPEFSRLEPIFIGKKS